MKKTLLIAAAAMLALASCSKGEAAKAEAENADPAQTEAVAEAAPEIKPVDGVQSLTDDSAIRPGMKADRLTVLDFNATWCGPCKMLHPVFEEAANSFKDVNFISIDIDKNPQTANAFGIEAVPTVIFIKPDGTTQTFVGTDELLPAEKFDKLIRDNK